MEEQKENVVHREGTPETKPGVTESTTPPDETPKADVTTKEPELTEEEKKKAEIVERKKKEKEERELKKKKEAYEIMQKGAYFMKFIYDDIERQKKAHLNRTQRRRFDKELRKGIFSRELIDVYTGKIDVALEWIDKNLNNTEQTINKISTHYHLNGYENPEFLRSILEDYFKGTFLLKGEEPPKEEEPVDGEKLYKQLKEAEARGELKVKDIPGINKNESK